MKILINKQLLTEALKNINNIVDSNNGNIQLTAVRIYTKENNLYLCATKGSASYQQIIQNIKIEKNGDILVKAKILYNIVSKLDSDEIAINQLDTSILQIKTSNYSCEINLLDNYSYPTLDFDHTGWEKITLSFDTIYNICTRIKPFVCSNDVYTVAQGIFFNAIDDKEMECVSSDHYKAAYYRFEYQGKQIKFVLEPEAIKFSYEIMLSKKTKTADFYIKDKRCMIQIEETTLTFSLFENSYPNIIPRILQSTKQSFSVKLKDLRDALLRGTVFVANEQRPIVNLSTEGTKLNIKFISAESGNSFEQIDIFENNSQNFVAQINQKYLMDIVSTIKSEKITFNFDGQFSPVTLTTENKYFVNLIMVIQSA